MTRLQVEKRKKEGKFRKMGCGPSKSDLIVVQDVTGMTKKDASESFSRFKKEAGGSKIKLDKFTKLVSSLNTNKGKIDLIFLNID